MSPDDPQILPWKRRDPLDHARFNALQERVITDLRVTGGGARFMRKGNVAALHIPKHRRTYQPLVRFKITGNESGGGKYIGKIWNPPGTLIPATGNLTEAELGTDSGTFIRALNTREVGQGTHIVSSATYLPLLFIGYFCGMGDDGTPCYQFDGLQHEECPE